jgi:very-short-patch-repair endonuclease
MANAVRREDLRVAIANAIAENVKSYDVADVCVSLLGLDPPKDQWDDPFRSKRVYVKSRLTNKSISELESMARKIIEEYGDGALEQLIKQLGVTGVAGEMKNLIFAAKGPKPRIVLRDAVNNVIEITENAEYCLVYDRPLSEQGLSWRNLTAWWASMHDLQGSERESALSLYRRLEESMANNECERLIFRTYAELYGRTDGFDRPALIPQVYLHYDPYTRQERGAPGPLPRQRMDFLLLLPHHQRVVIEVDGRQHYADENGVANTSRYAEMVKEDRSLRLAGYEVYRFGGKELMDGDASRELVREFFAELTRRHARTS